MSLIFYQKLLIISASFTILLVNLGITTQQTCYNGSTPISGSYSIPTQSRIPLIGQTYNGSCSSTHLNFLYSSSYGCFNLTSNRDIQYLQLNESEYFRVTGDIYVREIRPLVVTNFRVFSNCSINNILIIETSYIYAN